MSGNALQIFSTLKWTIIEFGSRHFDIFVIWMSVIKIKIEIPYFLICKTPSLFLNVFMLKFHYHFQFLASLLWSRVKIVTKFPQNHFWIEIESWDLSGWHCEPLWYLNVTFVTHGNGVLTMDFINRIYQIITKSWGWSDKYKAYIVIMTTFSMIDISQFKYFSFQWSECNNDNVYKYVLMIHR